MPPTTTRTRAINFAEMSFAAGGHIRTALLDEHRVLTCMAGYHNIFVVAHTDDTDRAREAADELHARHEGVRSIYLVLVTDEQMTAIADPGVVLNVAVQVAADDYTPAATAIRLYTADQLTITTEHGDFLTEITTTRELRAGDVYSCGTKRLGAPTLGLAVYRARTNYDPTTGEVQHHLVDRGYNPAPGKRTGGLTDGPDSIVFRLVDRAPLITRLNLDDIQPIVD